MEDEGPAPKKDMSALGAAGLGALVLALPAVFAGSVDGPGFACVPDTGFEGPA